MSDTNTPWDSEEARRIREELERGFEGGVFKGSLEPSTKFDWEGALGDIKKVDWITWNYVPLSGPTPLTDEEYNAIKGTGMTLDEATEALQRGSDFYWNILSDPLFLIEIPYTPTPDMIEATKKWMNANGLPTLEDPDDVG